MNSKQLFFALYNNRVTQPFFDGLFARDQLEEIIIKPQLVVANTAPSNSAGEHWVLFFFKGSTVDFFDSLGRNISEYPQDIANFIDRYSSETNYLSDRIQPLESDICGQYCLYYAFKSCQGYDMDSIMLSIQSPQQVLSFVSKHFILCNSSTCQLQHAIHW